MTEFENNRDKFLTFRKQFPVFCFDSYSITFDDNNLKVVYHFSCEEVNFSPSLTFYDITKPVDNEFETLVFNLGMVELLSYWKAFASPLILIKCGSLTKEQEQFFKKLYFNGLGEYFYLNGLVAFEGEEDLVTMDNFVSFQYEGPLHKKISKPLLNLDHQEFILPIGGGKDSVVSLELLRSKGKKIIPFAINPRGAIKDCVRVAGLDNLAVVKRSLDAKLLELNKQGYLNGHTPFSAIVAFTSLCYAYLTNRKYIALSNEQSANESTVKGLTINHQYSKSLVFEDDFRAYYKEFICEDFEYFSLLRPISELRIAEIFAQLPYLEVFKSCNVGSKQDIWCGHCPKCLFAYIILSPFIDPDKLASVFGYNLFSNKDLLKDFIELIGQGNVKPFECVGTVEEVNISLGMRCENFDIKEDDYLLKYWMQSTVAQGYINKDFTIFLHQESEQHNLPEDLRDIFQNTFLQSRKAHIIRLLQGKRIGIMGFGREGQSTYRFLKQLFNNQPFVLFDSNKQAFDTIEQQIKEDNDIIFCKQEDYSQINDLCDIIFLTPGISLKNLHDIDLSKITNQCDLFLQVFHNQTIGISGTKGKSTTSTLIYQAIEQQGLNTLLAGNIGVPVFDIFDKIKRDTLIVLELSCHQLQNIHRAPHISLLLNLYEEHLDHYNSYEEYQLTKINLLTKGTENDVFIYSQDSEPIKDWVKHFALKREYKTFSASNYSYQNPQYLKGEHNKGNILAVLSVVEALGLDKDKALNTCLNFNGLKHRLEFIARLNNVDYYNDSISTIAQATLAAMQSLQNVSVLILGGMDRGIDYQDISKVTTYPHADELHIAFVGKAGGRMRDIILAQNPDIDYIETDNWEEIILWAKQKAQPNTSVLLSPAASSYDQFKNFEHRGQVFSQLVMQNISKNE